MIIPTYAAGEPDPNPMFLEKRVYQGSSGRVYPLPVIDRIASERTDREYEAIHLENEYVYLMILPELGGRIHIGYDKISGYDFFYRQDVIKPALVGLAGPWISGGVEFNWPQHHRPATFMPVEWHLEEHEDGSKTVWLSDHDPMSRMKGMHGICLKPESTVVELKAKLYNRTPETQTFLWWANVAARVHERYQSFFPPDVRFVADHAKRAVSTFPSCAESYYGVPYGVRGRDGVPVEETPTQFVPDGSYPPDRLDWYANIPVPTSYMVTQTDFDFFGGYDHAAKAGFVHVADRHIAPGKKQWTWGNHDFGYAWDRNLTEEGGPYVELMAGVYTDNQPDFSFLAPYETKTFTQVWYPIRGIGPAQNASVRAAISVEPDQDGIQVGICVSSEVKGATLCVTDGETESTWNGDLHPTTPTVVRFAVKGRAKVRVVDAQGSEVVAFEGVRSEGEEMLEPATEPPAPEDVASNALLYRIGKHLEQYRHATRCPASYWREAIRRDEWDAESQLALGKWHLKRGEFGPAQKHLSAAVRCLTRYNPNPPTGEAHYELGRCMEFQGKRGEAYCAYAKASWNYDFKAAALFRLARLDCGGQDFHRAEERLRECLLGLGDHHGARCLLSAIHRRLGRDSHAELLEVLRNDPLNHWALREASLRDPELHPRYRSAMRGEAQNYLDLALDYAGAGLIEDALAVLSEAPKTPMVAYATSAIGGSLPPIEAQDTLFPSRLEEIGFLESAVAKDASDARAFALLWHMLYDRRRHSEGIACWERSVEIDPEQSVVWRNLGIGYHNILRDVVKAEDAYNRAVACRPDDARLWFERDQLWKRLGVAPQQRLRTLQLRWDLVESRDDLTLEACALLNQLDRPEEASRLLAGRVFQPWEGGEGIALGLFTRTQIALARRAIAEGDAERALDLLRRALDPPHSLGESRHLLVNASDLWFWLGEAHEQAGMDEEAMRWRRRAAEFAGDFQEMSVRSYSEMTFFSARCLQRLGDIDQARTLLLGLRDFAEQLARTPAKIDFFATSLPTLLLFEDDLDFRQGTTALLLKGLAFVGLGERENGEAILRTVLERDPNHALAQDILREVCQP